MSRIGIQPVKILDKVSVEVNPGGIYENVVIIVKGPLGELSEDIRQGISVKVENNEVLLSRTEDTKELKSLHGLYRSLVQNMVVGVTKGYEINLEIHGVGFRTKLVGRDLDLSLGQNHPIVFKAPEGIEFTVDKELDIKVRGIDKQLVGETAAKIRIIKKPEPYKGKGIRYQGEFVRRKVGKAAAGK